MEKNQNLPFVMTTDEPTAKQLKDSGLTILSDSNDRWVFVNSSKLVFENIEKPTKVAFTNVLCMDE